MKQLLITITVPALTILLVACALTPLEAVSDYPADAPSRKFVTAHVMAPSLLRQVSKFRSSAGHDYSDLFEQNRSMKHYFYPTDQMNRNADMRSPVDGMIISIEQEQMANGGYQVKILPIGYPEYIIIVFHVGVGVVKVGDRLKAGQVIGTNVANSFDVSVWRKDGRLISWFEVISDSMFDDYKARGANERSDFILSKEYRDAHPISQWNSLNESSFFTLQ